MKTHNVEIIKKWEGLRLKAYLPTPNDVYTIGYGHTRGVKPGMVITPQEAERLLREDLEWVERAINTKVKVGLNQNQFDALASFVFNVGETAFGKSTLLRKLNAGNYDGAAEEFPKWKYQKGKVLKGLVNRRADEMLLFLSAEDVVVSAQTVDEPEGLKPLWKSKEVVGGVTTVVAGFLGSFADLDPTVQLVVWGTIVAVGLGFVINRVVANRRGQR